MKILRLDSTDTAIAPAIMADSAWRPDRRPLFIPEDGRCSSQLRVALRVERLGKCVAERFAFRYLGSLAIVCYNSGPGFSDFSDDAVIHGSWLSLDGIDAPLHLVGSPLTAPVDYVFDRAEAARTLSHLSRLATFKTGDVIVLPQVLASFEPTPDSTVAVSDSARPADPPLLEFNVK